MFLEEQQGAVDISMSLMVLKLRIFIQEDNALLFDACNRVPPDVRHRIILSHQIDTLSLHSLRHILELHVCITQIKSKLIGTIC